MTNRFTKGLAGLAGIAALALGGSAIAGAATSSTTSTSTAATGHSQPPSGFKGPAHGTAAHEDAEKAVTGEAASASRG